MGAGRVGIGQVSFRQPVIAQQEMIPGLREVLLEQLRLAIDVVRGCVKGRQHLEARIVVQGLCNRLDDRRASGIGVLREERNQQQLANAGTMKARRFSRSARFWRFAEVVTGWG